MSADVLTPEITQGIDELEDAYPGRVVREAHDESGVIVRIREIELSVRWSPQVGDLWFVVPFHYPDAAIYPHYLTGAQPTGGVVPALQQVNWRGMPVIQVSLRHSGWNPAHDTACGSAMATMAWLRTT